MTARTRILVAEDDAFVRQIVVESLMDLDFEILEASSGANAVRLADDRKGIDLVVTDLNMPGRNGLEVAHHAREHHPNVPVLFMSGCPDLLLEAGPPEPFGFLAKPFRIKALTEAVDGLLGR